MKLETAEKLNNINHQFYNIVAKDFDESRNHHWPGWDKINTYISEQVVVLDIGCGNGRFGEYVRDCIDHSDYTGIDSNEFLLKQAKKRLPEYNFLNIDITKQDWKGISDDHFDLVGIFGVIHHIPGYKNRINIFNNIRSKLKKRRYTSCCSLGVYRNKQVKTKTSN